MSGISLVYPHQWFAKHPAVSKGREVWLIEEPLFFGNDARWPAAMHQQKLMLHRASMKAYAAELRGKGHQVRYIEFAEKPELPSQTKSIHLADPMLRQAINWLNGYGGSPPKSRAIRLFTLVAANSAL